MIVKNNEQLSKYTSFKIGGIAKNFFIPETEEELTELVKMLNEKNKNYYFLANGTNILINDKKEFSNIIYLNKFSSNIEINFKNEVVVGASVALNKFIFWALDNNLKVFTDLISVPATIGGAIMMNVTSGEDCISNNLVSVDYFDGKNFRTIQRDDCLFSYRDSIFNKKKLIILKARFKFTSGSKEVSLNLIKKKIVNFKSKDYSKYPSAGSIFKAKNYKIMKLLRGVKIGGAMFSKRTLNTIINVNNAKFSDVSLLIKLAQILHIITFQKCNLEIKIWK